MKELAAARIRANGFPVELNYQWRIGVSVGDATHLWSVQCLPPDAVLSPFWIQVDDTTGAAEFVLPVVQGTQTFGEDSDWLVKVYNALAEVSYPIELETLIRQAHFAGAESFGGGRDANGRWYLDYTLREEEDTPARFEVRCFFDSPNNPKIVVAAEVAYWDARLYRYLLVRN